MRPSSQSLSLSLSLSLSHTLTRPWPFGPGHLVTVLRPSGRVLIDFSTWPSSPGPLAFALRPCAYWSGHHSLPSRPGPLAWPSVHDRPSSPPLPCFVAYDCVSMHCPSGPVSLPWPRPLLQTFLALPNLPWPSSPGPLHLGLQPWPAGLGPPALDLLVRPLVHALSPRPSGLDLGPRPALQPSGPIALWPLLCRL